MSTITRKSTTITLENFSIACEMGFNCLDTNGNHTSMKTVIEFHGVSGKIE